MPPLSRLRRGLHWITAALVLGAAVLGLVMVRMEASSIEEARRLMALFSLHKSLGVMVLALTLWRLGAQLFRPVVPAGHATPERALSAAVQGAMLAALLLLAFSGLAQHALLEGVASIPVLPGGGPRLPTDPALADAFAAMHRMVGWLLGGALLLHLAGALKHHWWDRDGTLLRMLGRPGAVRPVESGDAARRMGGLAGVAVVALSGLGAFAAATGPAAAPVAAPPGHWTVLPAESRLSVRAEAMGMAVSARFERFDAEIRFDPERPSEMSVLVLIETPSFRSGVPEVDRAVSGGDWLDAEQEPMAQWRSTGPAVHEEGRWRLPGLLSIRGEEAPVDLSFTLSLDGDRARAEGSAAFQRAALALGRGETGGPDMAGPEIGVTFTIVAIRAEGG